MDRTLLGLIKDQQLLGLCKNCILSPEVWKVVHIAFNKSTHQTLILQQLKNRIKVLKRTFKKYKRCVDKSGWGWDAVNNIPEAPNDEEWAEEIAVSKFKFCN